MFVPPEEDRGGSAHTAAIDLAPLPTSAGLDTWATAVAPAFATRRIAMACPLALRATFILAGGIYFLALGGSIVTGISAPILDAVPLCLGPAAFFWAYCLIAFPRAARTRLFIESVFVVVALGLACLSISAPRRHCRCAIRK